METNYRSYEMLPFTLRENKADEKYYLRSKMIVPFLEFDFLWEKFVYTLVNTNCTFTGKCSFHKKEFTKSFEEIEKVNKLFLPFDRKLIHKRIFSCPN